jgi:hypothetical protein
MGSKSTIGILLVVIPNSIPTGKTGIFWGVKKSLIYLLPRGGISETHQVYYPETYELEEVLLYIGKKTNSKSIKNVSYS